MLTPESLIDAGGLYVTGEDNLRLTTIGSLAGVTVALEGRRVTPSGCIVPLGERHVASSNRVASSNIFPLGDGVLTHVQLRASAGAPRRGQTFAILEVVRGRDGTVQPLATLLQGYVTTTPKLAWPGIPIGASSDGPGLIRSVTGTNPAAG